MKSGVKSYIVSGLVALSASLISTESVAAFVPYGVQYGVERTVV